MNLETVKKNLEAAGENLCSELKQVRSMQCAEKPFALFWASGAVKEAIAYAGQSRGAAIEIKTSFQKSISELYNTSKTWNHCLSKPFGYPGDYLILEWIYDCLPHPETETAAGKIVDCWGLSQELPRAVAARKSILRSILEDYSRNLTGRAKVLSIASGSARELREMMPSLLSRLEVELLDMDARSRAFVKHYFKSQPVPPSVKYIQADALVGGNADEIIKEESPFNLIYSFGLFDYLKDEMLIASANSFIPMLADDGKFIFALKDKRYYNATVYDWFYNWRFVPRVFDDGFKLAEAVGLKVEKSYITDGQTIGIYECTKKSATPG